MCQISCAALSEHIIVIYFFSEPYKQKHGYEILHIICS